jgi:hypothetical protein
MVDVLSKLIYYRYGKLNVTIAVKKEVFNSEPKRNKRKMLFKKFLLDYMYENWYLSSTVHEDMMAELPVYIFSEFFFSLKT